MQQPPAFLFKTVAIVGVGLIGGSIGMATRRQSIAERVIGIGRDSQRLKVAVDCGAISEFTTAIEAGVVDADLIIVCAPVELIPPLVQQVASSCRADALITDVGSTKQRLIEQVEANSVPGQACFVGSHPLAGSEKTGVANARADLLEGRRVVVTPTPSNATTAVERLVAFWEALGANVSRMSPEDHDQALAMTSHLPHVVASVLAATTPAEQLHLAATGWLDTTRIAAGDVELWRQILLQNRPSVLRSLAEFGKVLSSFEHALQQNDEAAIRNLLATGKQRRDALAD